MKPGLLRVVVSLAGFAAAFALVAIGAVGLFGSDRVAPAELGSVGTPAPEAVAHRPQPTWTWSTPVEDGLHQLLPVAGGIFAGLGRTVAVLADDGTPRWSYQLDEATDWKGTVPGTSIMVGAGVDGASIHGITALDLGDGRVLWQSDNAFEEITRFGVLTREDRDLVMRNARTGLELWRIGVPDELVAAGPGIYVANDGVVHQLSGATGGVVWQYRAGDVTGLQASPAMLVVARARSVIALSPGDATRLWSVQAPHGATVGLLTDRLAWVHYTPKAEEDFPASTVRILDLGGRSHGTLRLGKHEGFEPTQFLGGRATYLLNRAGGRLYDHRLDRVGTYPGASLVPASTGIYALADDKVSLTAFGGSAPRWTLPLPDSGGLSTLVLERVLYVVGPAGVTRYA